VDFVFDQERASGEVEPDQTMTVTCETLDDLLFDASPEAMRAAEEHAAQCAACAEKLEAWNEISATAKSMKNTWHSDLLWPRIEKVPVSVFGVSLHEGWFHDFLAGLLVAGGLLLLTLAGSFLFGHARVESSGSLSVIPAILATLLVLAVSAMNEELVFRGYPFQVFLKSLRPWGAMLLISFIFGLLHAPNPGATPLSILNTILAGVFLCRAYLMTRSLWLPYGIHLGWNAGLSVVLGYPVSGIDTPSILKTSVAGSDLILGGTYGPEGGVLGTVLFLTATIVIGWLPIGRVSPEMRASLSAHADKAYIEET